MLKDFWRVSENFGMLCIKGLRSGDFWVSFANQVGKVSLFSYETNKGPAPLHSFQKYFISKFKICFYVFAKWRWNLLKNYPEVMQFRSRHLLTLFSMGLFGVAQGWKGALFKICHTYHKRWNLAQLYIFRILFK